MGDISRADKKSFCHSCKQINQLQLRSCAHLYINSHGLDKSDKIVTLAKALFSNFSDSGSSNRNGNVIETLNDSHGSNKLKNEAIPNPSRCFTSESANGVLTTNDLMIPGKICASDL